MVIPERRYTEFRLPRHGLDECLGRTVGITRRHADLYHRADADQPGHDGWAESHCVRAIVSHRSQAARRPPREHGRNERTSRTDMDGLADRWPPKPPEISSLAFGVLRRQIPELGIERGNSARTVPSGGAGWRASLARLSAPIPRPIILVAKPNPTPRHGSGSRDWFAPDGVMSGGRHPVRKAGVFPCRFLPETTKFRPSSQTVPDHHAHLSGIGDRFVEQCCPRGIIGRRMTI